MRYCDTVTHGTDLSQYSFVYKANSAFDPDSTGTGHQPYGYDQLTPLFREYSVLSSKIVVRFTPSPGQTVPLLGFVRKVDIPPVGVPDPRVIREAMGSRHRIITTQANNNVLTMGWNCKEMMSRADNIGVMENTTLAGGTDPATVRYWHIGWISQNGLTVGANTVQLDVTIIYKVMLTGARDLPIS